MYYTSYFLIKNLISSIVVSIHFSLHSDSSYLNILFNNIFNNLIFKFSNIVIIFWLHVYYPFSVEFILCVVGRVLYTFAIHECFRTSCFTNYLQNVGMLLVFVYDLYFLKQFIDSNLSLLRVYTSSWLYVTCLPFLVVNVITVLVPINDFLITNLLVVMLFVLVLFDIVFSLFN